MASVINSSQSQRKQKQVMVVTIYLISQYRFINAQYKWYIFFYFHFAAFCPFEPVGSTQRHWLDWTVDCWQWKQQVRGCWGFFCTQIFIFSTLRRSRFSFLHTFRFLHIKTFFNTRKKKNLLHRISTEPERLSPDSSAVDVAKHRSPSSPCELYDVDFDWWGNQTESSSAAWTELWNH